MESLGIIVVPRSSKALVISFRPRDIESMAALHNYTLVILVTIVNYDIASTFIDLGEFNQHPLQDDF